MSNIAPNHVYFMLSVDKSPFNAKEALESPSDPRDNGAVITGQDWIDGWQAARLLGLRADHGQEADQAGEVSL